MGSTRPGWGRTLERMAEQPALGAASLVASGSDLVAEQVHRLGVAEKRILVTPTGVDLDLFAERPDPRALRQRLGLEGRFVVGWVGSFRRFHALEQAIDAVAALDNAALLLVGDGPERPRIEQLTRERGITAAFTGTVPHADLPGHLAAMDVALVLASPGDTFTTPPSSSPSTWPLDSPSSLLGRTNLRAGSATVSMRCSCLPETATRSTRRCVCFRATTTPATASGQQPGRQPSARGPGTTKIERVLTALDTLDG